MTYSAGQVVEVCSERSRKWTSGFKYGSKITLTCLCTGRWEAVTATGVRGIISEDDFRPVPEHSPVRTETVTVRRLEPGVYGRLSVHTGEYQPENVYISITNLNGVSQGGQLVSAPELRELARVTLEIAEYLENA